ncbi:MAG: hypothetical protein GC190_09540 [Alphaproteobacteria bacterium]|nr:hypothetical protein [Alphaproteobacteria bacterium]
MSNDRFVEVSRQGYFSRLANSFVGILIGFVLVVGAIPLLWWNEDRAVKAQRALDEATRLVVDIEPSGADAANNGRLVHVSGDATSHTPIRDGDLNLVFTDVVVVARTVEMYQWIEHKNSKTVDETGGSQQTETKYDYRQGWSDEWNNSEDFRHPTGHANPPMPMQSQSWIASGTTLGAFTLQREALLQLQGGSPMQPDKIPEGWKQDSEGLYKGDDPAVPKLGDLRVRYHVISSPAPVSVLARQMGTGFESYEMPNGYQIFLVKDGHLTSEEMIQRQRDREHVLTWLIRAGGLFAMWMGFCLAMGPLRALANVLPFLANVAGFAIAVVAAALALPLSLGTIGLAWLFYRPLIGLGAVVVGIAAGWALVRYRHHIAPASAARG